MIIMIIMNSILIVIMTHQFIVILMIVNDDCVNLKVNNGSNDLDSNG